MEIILAETMAFVMVLSEPLKWLMKLPRVKVKVIH